MSIRVLHVVDTFGAHPGDAAILLRGLLDALTERGIEPQVLTGSGETGGNAPVPVHAYAVDRLSGLVSDHDIIHLHGWGTDPVFTATAKTARKLGKPYVLSPHGSLTPGPHTRRTWKDKLGWLLRDKALVAEASAIIALNDFEANDLRDRGGLANTIVLPFGIDFAAYAANGEHVDLPTLPEGRCLLMLAPLDPIEGHVPLLKAFAETGGDADGWFIALIGRERGDWRRLLEPAIRRKDGANRVIFADAPDEATQRAWLDRASLLAAPNLHIRAAVSIMQAVASGKAVLASDRVAPPMLSEAITVVPPSRDKLRAALSNLLTASPEELSAAGEQAREAAAEYDWPVWAKRFEDLYRGLA